MKLVWGICTAPDETSAFAAASHLGLYCLYVFPKYDTAVKSSTAAIFPFPIPSVRFIFNFSIIVHLNLISSCNLNYAVFFISSYVSFAY